VQIEVKNKGAGLSLPYFGGMREQLQKESGEEKYLTNARLNAIAGQPAWGSLSCKLGGINCTFLGRN